MRLNPRYQIVLAGLTAALASCDRANPEAAIQPFLTGDCEAASAESVRWSEVGAPDPAPHFILSVCAYLNDDVETLEEERTAALAGPDASARLADWLATLAPTEPRLQVLLPAIAAQLRDQTDAASQLYRDAIDATEDAELDELYQHNLASVANGHASARIFDDDPLTYQGSMTLAGQTWVPVDGSFDVTGGEMRSAITKVYPELEGLAAYNEVRARFGDWAIAERSSDGEPVSWAPLLTEGEIYMSRTGIDEDDEGNVEFKLFDDLAASAAAEEDRWHVEFDVRYDTHPVDYFGRFVRISLGEGKAYPVLVVEEYKHATEGTFLQIALGTEFDIRARHFTGSSGGLTFFGGGAMVNQVDNGRLTGPVHRLIRF